jgi:Sulfotransferase family
MQKLVSDLDAYPRRLGASMLQLLKFKRRRAAWDAKPTFYLHIPKCAGSTLWEVIWDIYGTRDVFLAKSRGQRARLSAMPMEKRLSYSAVGGHGGLKFFRDTLGDLSRYHKIVTLRDPIDRVISEYNYIRTRPQHRLHKMVAAGDFETYMKETAEPNHQVKLLTGSADESDRAFEIVTQFFDDWCLTAEIGQMAERLYEVTGTPPRPVAHKNIARSPFSRRDLAPATLRFLEDQNRHDLALLEALRCILV